MEIVYLNEVDSTHTYLKKYIKDKGYTNPLLVYTHNQTNGIGSRDNNWEGKSGNLFFSFVLDKDLLPQDLPIQSFSIYFSLMDLQDKHYTNKDHIDFFQNEETVLQNLKRI